MKSVSLFTPDDFQSRASRKRKTHSTIACVRCRRLKIRCLAGPPPALATSLDATPCRQCISHGSQCLWPEEDGRKRGRTSAGDAVESLKGQRESRDGELFEPAALSVPTATTTGIQEAISGQCHQDQNNHRANGPAFHRQISYSKRGDAVHGQGRRALAHQDATEEVPASLASASPQETDSYATVHYFRHLGPTAIAPGHKKLSLKVRQDHGDPLEGGAFPHCSPDTANKTATDSGLLPLFDRETSLPATAILPQLLDSFFEYYGDNFCFLNRAYLDQLIDNGEASSFLVCSMSALSSRFCPSVTFAAYFQPKTDGTERARWEYSIPFIDRAKQLLMPLLSIPSCDVVAGLLLLAWADFGDNNEAGACLRFHTHP